MVEFDGTGLTGPVFLFGKRRACYVPVPQAETQQFGTIEYDDTDAIEFPLGLPAFESEKRFVLVRRPEVKPVVFLQSLQNKMLCFVTLPVEALDRNYRAAVSEDDLEILAAGADLSEGGAADDRFLGDLTCLAILSVTDSRPTANLLAPVVVHRKTGRGVQAIRVDNLYSHQHPVGALCS